MSRLLSSSMLFVKEFLLNRKHQGEKGIMLILHEVNVDIVTFKETETTAL